MVPGSFGEWFWNSSVIVQSGSEIVRGMFRDGCSGMVLVPQVPTRVLCGANLGLLTLFLPLSLSLPCPCFCCCLCPALNLANLAKPCQPCSTLPFPLPPLRRNHHHMRVDLHPLSLLFSTQRRQHCPVHLFIPIHLFQQRPKRNCHSPEV